MSGAGKRFKDKGYSLPKPLVPISGRPILQHVIDMFPGIEDVLLIVNREHFEDSELHLEARLIEIAPMAKIAVIEPHKLGPGWALHQSMEYIKSNVPVVVNYCDFACIWDFNTFREKLQSGIDGLIATYSGFHPHMLRDTQYAYLKLNSSGNLTQIQEKLPFTSQPMNEPASSGTYGFASGQILLDAVAKQISNGDSYNGEFYSSLTYKNMIDSGKIVKNYEIEKFFQWGTPENFEDFKMQKDFFSYKLARPEKSIAVNRIEILAAGEGKRFSELGYKTIKPFLPAGENFLALQSLNSLGMPMDSKGILFQDKFLINTDDAKLLADSQVTIRKVGGLTSGQAESALVALSSEYLGSCIIGSCDSLLYPNPNFEFPKHERTLCVWVVKPSEFALVHPEQFGWVSLDLDGTIKDSWVKVAPKTSQDVFVITGVFYFSDDREGSMLLEKFLTEGGPVNNEFYLDSVLMFAADNGWKVTGLFPDWFVSLGTPEEYNVFRYWESVFNSRRDLLVND
jgi:dTDP-glucose pyrophosphorylase